MAQVNAVREALDEEEQRLLEAVQREEERIEQCLLTQRAHWSKSLNTLTHARTSLVHKLTHATDTIIVVRTEEKRGGGFWSWGKQPGLAWVVSEIIYLLKHSQNL